MLWEPIPRIIVAVKLNPSSSVNLLVFFIVINDKISVNNKSRIWGL